MSLVSNPGEDNSDAGFTASPPPRMPYPFTPAKMVPRLFPLPVPDSMGAFSPWRAMSEGSDIGHRSGWELATPSQLSTRQGSLGTEAGESSVSRCLPRARRPVVLPHRSALCPRSPRVGNVSPGHQSPSIQKSCVTFWPSADPTVTESDQLLRACLNGTP